MMQDILLYETAWQGENNHKTVKVSVFKSPPPAQHVSSLSRREGEDGGLHYVLVSVKKWNDEGARVKATGVTPS